MYKIKNRNPLYKEKMKTWLKKEVHAKINFRLKEFELIGYVKQSG